MPLQERGAKYYAPANIGLEIDPVNLMRIHYGPALAFGVLVCR